MIPAPTTITSACTGPIFAEGPSSDTVAQDADALDLQLDDIARLQPAAVAMLEDAAGPDCPGAENVSRTEVGVPCRVRHDGVPRVMHGRQIPARALLTVHARDHRPARAVELVRGHEHRADARGEILSLRRAEPDFHLGPLQIARGPVVHDREAPDPGVCPDDRCDLELVVELIRIGRSRDLVLRTVDRCRIGEVENRLLVPLRRNLLAAQRSRRLDVLLEHIEVAYRGRVQDGGTEVALGERILGVPPRASAAGEIRLQRLRCELHDRVTLDDPGPAAFELQVARREHAELHGSVCTITSAMSGRARRIRSSISLARAWASASGLAASRPRVR